MLGFDIALTSVSGVKKSRQLFSSQPGGKMLCSLYNNAFSGSLLQAVLVRQGSGAIVFRLFYY